MSTTDITDSSVAMARRTVALHGDTRVLSQLVRSLTFGHRMTQSGICRGHIYEDCKKGTLTAGPAMAT